MADGDDVLEFGLEDTAPPVSSSLCAFVFLLFLPVEVLGCTDSNEGVRVCEGREDTNPGALVSMLAPWFPSSVDFLAYSLEFSN